MTLYQVAQKTCTRCGDVWPRDAEFFRQETRGGGYYLPWCRACEADQKREYRAVQKAAHSHRPSC
jgi:hypothetical protein